MFSFEVDSLQFIKDRFIDWRALTPD